MPGYIGDLKTKSPIMSWVPHELGVEETQMAVNVANLPFVYKHLALMPDAHLGKGAMVGSVIATKDAIIPAAVGVDLGCGMMACKLPFKASALEGKQSILRQKIESKIPVGFDQYQEISREVNAWKGWKHFSKLHPGVQNLSKKAQLQLGTLGGGNHFIEICVEQEQADPNLWVMLHSGSRHIGNSLATCHIRTAKQLAKLAKTPLPDKELSYFVAGTDEFNAYWYDIKWAQEYALKNREVMMDTCLRIIAKVLNEGEIFTPLTTVNCHHNYATLEHHFGEDLYITRKGAVRAGINDYGIIPGSMGTKSYIVKGKGNENSFCSCSHGAGRLMSRTQAKKRFTLNDLKWQTEGVECRKDAQVIDEIPAAYKNIDTVMEAQSDLVEMVACLKQTICIKG